MVSVVALRTRDGQPIADPLWAYRDGTLVYWSDADQALCLASVDDGIRWVRPEGLPAASDVDHVDSLGAQAFIDVETDAGCGAWRVDTTSGVAERLPGIVQVEVAPGGGVAWYGDDRWITGRTAAGRQPRLLRVPGWHSRATAQVFAWDDLSGRLVAREGLSFWCHSGATHRRLPVPSWLGTGEQVAVVPEYRQWWLSVGWPSMCPHWEVWAYSAVGKRLGRVVQSADYLGPPMLATTPALTRVLRMLETAGERTRPGDDADSRERGPEPD